MVSSSFLKRLATEEILMHPTVKDSLTAEELTHKALMVSSLHAFILEFWDEVMGDIEFMDNWHIKAICDHLQACCEGKIKIMIINIAPRCMKSLIISVFFPAWLWTHNPSSKFFNLSGTFSLAVRDNIRCRRLIQSKKYQKYWSDVYSLHKDANTSTRYENTKGGQKIIKSVYGNPIGEGGDFLVVDDPNVSQDIYSEVTRNRTNDIISSSFGIRSDSPASKIGALIIIQQRLHPFDVTGYMLGLGLKGIVHLMLPMEFEPNRRAITIDLDGSGKPWQDPRTTEGELLWPQRFSKEYVDDRLKKFLKTSANINCQLQQNPLSMEGDIFKKEWFKLWTNEYSLDLKYVIQSWDTAISTSEEACDSACTTWGIFQAPGGKNQILLLNCLLVKLAHVELRKFIIKCANNYMISGADAPYREGPKPDLILIEKAANGQALLDDLRSANLPLMGFDPKNHGLKNELGNNATSKIGRAHLVSSLIEQGLVYLAPGIPAQRFLQAALTFPRGGKDIVDSMSQAFITIIKRRMVYYTGEQPEEPLPNWREYNQQQQYMNGNDYGDDALIDIQRKMARTTGVNVQ